MAAVCDHAPAFDVVGPVIHVTCVCGLDYYVPRTTS